MALQVVVSPFLGVLFDNLTSLIQKEVGLIWGVDKEMKKLASILSTISDVLEDAEEKQITDKAVANWLLKLRALSYDADDILDEWGTEARELQMGAEHVARSKQVCLSYFSCFNFAQVVFRCKIAKRVNDLLERFDDIVKEKSDFGLRVGGVERSGQHYRNRETSSLPTDVYGRDEEKDFIVRQVIDDVGSEEGVAVHPIVGIGGLGKTTLAQVCFDDQRVQEHFDVRIWVCVSGDFDVKRLTRAVVNSDAKETCNLEELEPLQCLLREKLGQKRFLLVLDDVWNENQEKWNMFEASLRCGAVGSSVIVTTRLITVASIASTRAPFFLKPLSEDDCLSLFRQRAFGKGNDENPKLLKIGEEIVKKCGGVPLATKVLGGLLRFKGGEKEWLNVRDSKIWELPQTEENTILPALRLSYTHLAPHLRECFTYCSLFPKDHRMNKKDLIRLWMANGFIQSKGEMQMEDIGDEIFNDLLWRSFFQDVKKNLDGHVVSCMMHDLIHDLASSINKNECYHLAESTQIRNVHQVARHFSINCATTSYEVTRLVHQLAPNLRTLMLMQYDLNKELIIDLVGLKYLRAFSLISSYHWESWTIQKELMDSLGNLKHLRYLKISRARIELLANSICKLRNLETLDLEGCQELEKLPEQMGNMISLRHLDLEGCEKLNEMPAGMGKLIWLHTLSFFIVGSGEGRGIKELQGLNYLSGELKIKGLEHVKTKEEAKEASLMGKPNLISLKLSWGRGSDMMIENYQSALEGLQPHRNLKRLNIDGYEGLTFPKWFDSLSNLVEISIRGCSRCEHLPSSLGTLPLLRRLVIAGMKSVKFFFVPNSLDDHNAYLSLEHLEIRSMEELEDWYPLFPRLVKLIIQNCPKLKTLLPPSSASSSSLQTLTLSGDCNPTLLGSIHNLPTLSKLSVYSCAKSISLPEESLQNLPSLKSLQFHLCHSLQSLPSLNLPSLTALDLYYCPSLTNVSLALRYQTSLQTLCIVGCPKADISAVEYQHLSSLQTLEFGGNNDMTILPDGLQNLSSTLQSLQISYWYALSSLSDWIGSFTNLKTLILHDCKDFRSLPDTLRQLTNLQCLSIINCHPELHGRCEKETGEDWPKIAHIPSFINEQENQ